MMSCDYRLFSLFLSYLYASCLLFLMYYIDKNFQFHVCEEWEWTPLSCPNLRGKCSLSNTTHDWSLGKRPSQGEEISLYSEGFYREQILDFVKWFLWANRTDHIFLKTVKMWIMWKDFKTLNYLCVLIMNILGCDA